MEIVVLDGETTNPGDQSWDPIRDHGDLTVHPRTPVGEILERATGAEVLLTNKTPLTEEMLRELPTLEFVSLLATGYDNVDVEAARGLGIPVSNVPEYATESVGEHTIGLLLELVRGVGEHDRAVQAGDWEACEDFAFWTQSIRELTGRTLGIVGFGRIGRRVGRIGRAFGMRVLGATRSSEVSPEFDRFEQVSTREIFERADIVSLHCPLTEETEGMVDAEALASMSEEAFLINTGRGELVDESALAEALERGDIAGAAVDVVSEEPIEPANPLLDAPNCVITPHNAWASVEARGRLIQTTADNIEAFAAGAPVNVVN